MNKEQMQARLAKAQQDRQSLAVSIDQAIVRLHELDGQIQLMTELLAEATEFGRGAMEHSDADLPRNTGMGGKVFQKSEPQ